MSATIENGGGAASDLGNNLSKVSDAAMDAARTSIKFVRSASIKIKEKMDESGVTEYSQQMAAKIVNEGVPTVTQKLKELLDLLWKNFVEFLDSKGLKEPLEQFFMKCRDLPLVKTVWSMLKQLFTMLWKMVVKQSPGQKQETVGDSTLTVNMSDVVGDFSMDEEVPQVRTPTPNTEQVAEGYGSGTEGGRTTPEQVDN
eukprot:TRINITY_DN7138_c0_g5_i1.p2 TRINITY_DN7138_c0_g5~~TRINITY_DN7138_c0_g5_i1.p2  ORF type:complete len:199 (-),score=43.36 TRINITY_DN7138_c0_g5_i1:1152-1748(-)